MATLLSLTLKVILLAIPLLIFRLTVILNSKRRRAAPTKRGAPAHLLIVLGSGGHTAEMIAMLERAVTETDPKQKLQWSDYTQVSWIVGSDDKMSTQRATAFEKWATRHSIENNKSGDTASQTSRKAAIITVPRAREIHQSLLTSPFTSLRCMLACLVVLLDANSKGSFPDVVLCNGPATATILVFASILLRLFNVGGCETKGKMRTVYVESWARVRKLSLSGRLLSHVVDRFLVQWPQLEARYGGRVEYLGVLV